MAGGHILVADIGGTNSRFAVFLLRAFGLCGEGNNCERRGLCSKEGYCEEADNSTMALLSLRRRVTLPTGKAESFADLARGLSTATGQDGGCFLPSSPKPVDLKAAVLGLPAPVAGTDPAQSPDRNEVCRCPNISWPIAWEDARAALGVQQLYFVNDFVAQGFACTTLEQELDLDTILPGRASPGAPLGLVGAGTGLGQCLVLKDEEFRVLPSEGGHSLFPFAGDEEFAFARYLREATGQPWAIKDAVVSGSGLAHIHAYLTGEKLHPRDVSAKLAEHPKTLEWFARFYGRACRDFALNSLPLGGLYISGGVAANVPAVLRHPAFAAELRDMPPMAHVLEPLPVHHIRSQDAGLWGAAVFAALALFPGVTLIPGGEGEEEAFPEELLRTGAR